MKHIFKVLSFVALAMISSACSSQLPDEGLGIYSSTDPSGNNNGGGNTGGGNTGGTTQPLVATCSNYSKTAGNLHGKIKSYYDSLGIYNSNFVRLRMSAVPEGFGASDNVYIQFFRWRVSPSQTVEIDRANPLRFRLENPNTGGIASGWYGRDPNCTPTATNTCNVGFNRQQFYNAAGAQDMSLLSSFNFLIQGTDASLGFQVVRIEITQVTEGATTNLGFADMLIPNFYANPNTYASTHPDLLNQLHPNWSRRNEGWSDANFLAFANQSCF